MSSDDLSLMGDTLLKEVCPDRKNIEFWQCLSITQLGIIILPLSNLFVTEFIIKNENSFIE